MNLQQTTSHAQSDENSMEGFKIDGYEIEFTKQVALMPVDLIAQKPDEKSQKKR